MESWLIELIKKEALDILDIFLLSGWSPTKAQYQYIVAQPPVLRHLITKLPLPKLDGLANYVFHESQEMTQIIQKFKDEHAIHLTFTSCQLAYNLLNTPWRDSVLQSKNLFPRMFAAHPETLSLLQHHELEVNEEVLENYVRQRLLQGLPITLEDQTFHALLNTKKTQSEFKVKLVGLLTNLQDPRALTIELWHLYVSGLSSCNRKYGMAKIDKPVIKGINAPQVIQMAKANHLTKEDLRQELLEEIDRRDFPKQRQQWSPNGIRFILQMEYPIALEGLIRLIRNWSEESEWIYSLKAHYLTTDASQQKQLRRLLLTNQRYLAVQSICKPTELPPGELALVGVQPFNSKTTDFLTLAIPFNSDKLLLTCCRERNDSLACFILKSRSVSLEMTINILLNLMPNAYRLAKEQLSAEDQTKLASAEKYCFQP